MSFKPLEGLLSKSAGMLRAQSINPTADVEEASNQ